MRDIINSDSREERETVYRQTADNRDVWHAWTNDPVMDRKLRRMGAVVEKEYTTPNGKETVSRSYTLAGNQVSLRKPTKPLTDKEKKEKSYNLSKNLGRLA